MWLLTTQVLLWVDRDHCEHQKQKTKRNKPPSNPGNLGHVKLITLVPLAVLGVQTRAWYTRVQLKIYAHIVKVVSVGGGHCLFETESHNCSPGWP